MWEAGRRSAPWSSWCSPIIHGLTVTASEPPRPTDKASNTATADLVEPAATTARSVLQSSFTFVVVGCATLE